ncbi:MAG: succinyl-diaminopimelate desuccinylase, partial [Alphaproteobacteria bacterium]|nr:succinyl-diaminopimelate desuccinylase [Alphaproteobacteria bacterium]
LNLYAEFGSAGNNICFAGHVDVVPSGPLSDWHYDPFDMKVVGDHIYGRGAVDMKGAVFCMIHALIDWANSKQSGRVSLLLTSDEEAKATYGTNKMLEWLESQNIKIDFCIVGEPTCSEVLGDTIKIGRRGSVNFSLVVQGVQGHVAYPELARNPHDQMVKILDLLKKYKIDEGSEFFAPSNLEIVSIDTGNNITNLIPSRTTASFNVRNSDITPSKLLIQNITSLISSITNDFILNYTISAESFLSRDHDFISEFTNIVAMQTGANTQLGTGGGTSDARFIQKYAPVIEFGLLNASAHQANENTQISHLQKLHKVYIGAIKSFHKI